MNKERGEASSKMGEKKGKNEANGAPRHQFFPQWKKITSLALLGGFYPVFWLAPVVWQPAGPLVHNLVTQWKKSPQLFAWILAFL